MGMDGSLFVVEYGNNAIREIDTNGVVSTFVGNTTSGNTDGIGPNAQFNRPYSICVSPGGDQYVIDTDNHRIRRITQE